MISYEPLLNTLKEKGISFEELNEKVNGGKMLRSSLNKCSYISLEMLDAICNILEVSVDKVILHTRGNQPGENKIKVNWDRLCDKAAKERYPLSVLSKKCHLDTSYLSQAKRRNSMLPEKTVKSICKFLECNIDDIILIEDVKK